MKEIIRVLAGILLFLAISFWKLKGAFQGYNTVKYKGCPLWNRECLHRRSRFSQTGSCHSLLPS